MFIYGFMKRGFSVDFIFNFRQDCRPISFFFQVGPAENGLHVRTVTISVSGTIGDIVRRYLCLIRIYFIFHPYMRGIYYVIYRGPGFWIFCFPSFDVSTAFKLS